jgi:hypothetical protein
VRHGEVSVVPILIDENVVIAWLAVEIRVASEDISLLHPVNAGLVSEADAAMAFNLGTGKQT